VRADVLPQALLRLAEGDSPGGVEQGAKIEELARGFAGRPLTGERWPA